MAQTSDELRNEIERTREEMGDTVEALAYKADVPSRTKEWMSEKKDAVVSKVSGTSSRAGEMAPDSADVRRRADALKSTAERNPLGLAIAGAAVGFVAGILTPSTRIEDERIGPVADEVKSTATEVGQEAIERGKTVVQEVGTTALDTAKDSSRDQAEELSESLQSQARDISATDTEVTGRPSAPQPR